MENINQNTQMKHHYIYKTDSKKVYYNLNWTSINFDDSPCTAFIIRDETALVELAQKKDEENYTKRLVASITHDLRTPLNGIMGITDALEEFVFPEGRHFLKLAKNTGMLMLYLINDVLDMVQIEAKKLRLWKAKHNPKETIEETVELMKFNFIQKRIELGVWFASNIPSQVYTDMSRYRQILLNLLGNALKFTSKGSVSVEIYYDQKYDMLISKVSDTGTGIPADAFPRLFQLFSKISNTERINPNGVGLGLHICKQLSQQLGGDIFAESFEGEGSTFIFYISCGITEEVKIGQESFVTQVESKSQEITHDYIKSVMDSSSQKISCEVVKLHNNNTTDISKIHVEMPGLKHKQKSMLELVKEISDENDESPKVLLVDDNQMNLFVLMNYLKDTKIKADIAYNGKEAIDLIHKKNDDEIGWTGYNVIYMDINMPVMDGVEATGLIKTKIEENKIPKMPVVALSAGAATEYKGDSIFEEVMDKPITREKFLKSVAKYLHV